MDSIRVCGASLQRVSVSPTRSLGKAVVVVPQLLSVVNPPPLPTSERCGGSTAWWHVRLSHVISSYRCTQPRGTKAEGRSPVASSWPWP
jgi:hypothetical protein